MVMAPEHPMIVMSLLTTSGSANPNSSIRLAGGKKARLSEKTIELLMKHCVDSAIVGNYLTTTGFSAQDDAEHVINAGKTVKTCNKI